MAATRYLVQEKKEQKKMIFYRALGSAKLRQVASGSATQGLWLGNKKVESKVISEHR